MIAFCVYQHFTQCPDFFGPEVVYVECSVVKLKKTIM